MLLSIGLIVAGLAVAVFFSEQLVKGTVGFARGLGVSAFLVSVIFLGFDPENLAVGVSAKKTGQDGLESADGHTAVVGRGDKFGERRQPRARAAGKVYIDPITNERDRTLENVVGRYDGDAARNSGTSNALKKYLSRRAMTARRLDRCAGRGRKSPQSDEF